jgi:hypothetical protein
VPERARPSLLQEKVSEIEGIEYKHIHSLLDGKAVTLPNNRVVTPDQVTESAPLPQCFAFVFMPDLSYVDSFINTNLLNYADNIVSIYHSVPK